MDLKESPAVVLGISTLDGRPVISIGVDVKTYSDECLLVHFHFSLGKLSKTPEGLCKEVGVHLYASRGASQVGELNREKVSGIGRWWQCGIARVESPSTAGQRCWSLSSLMRATE